MATVVFEQTMLAKSCSAISLPIIENLQGIKFADSSTHSSYQSGMKSSVKKARRIMARGLERGQWLDCRGGKVYIRCRACWLP